MSFTLLGSSLGESFVLTTSSWSRFGIRKVIDPLVLFSNIPLFCQRLTCHSRGDSVFWRQTRLTLLVHRRRRAEFYYEFLSFRTKSGELFPKRTLRSRLSFEDPWTVAVWGKLVNHSNDDSLGRCKQAVTQCDWIILVQAAAVISTITKWFAGCEWSLLCERINMANMHYAAD